MTKKFSFSTVAFPCFYWVLCLATTGIWSCAPTVNQGALRAPMTEPIVSLDRATNQTDAPAPETVSLDLEEDLRYAALASDGGTFPTEEVSLPEPEITVNEEVADLEKLGAWDQPIAQPDEPEEEVITYDFPITYNRQVDYYLDFFQHKNRRSFERWLIRSGRYLPMIQEKLKEAGLPLDLAYLPMIESGFSLTAYSRARAVGLWQFMRGTGRHFGLKVDNYVDERRDPIKSTQAAIAYLQCLYSEFNSWELAVAGYNAGEGRIRRGIKKYKTTDFWKLAERRFLPGETKRYVPKLIAAILIAKEPNRYGFSNLTLDSPLDFEYAQVPRWTSLKAIAVALGINFGEIHDLNRELKKQITPPDQESYRIKIPSGSSALLAENLPRVRATVTTSFKNHTIHRGETLNQICRKYHLNKTTILKANDLRHSKMPAGKILRIPYQETKYVLLSPDELDSSTLAGRGGDFLLHTIKPGETIAQIARRYHVAPHLIASWNGLENINRIRAGQQLALYISQGTPKSLQEVTKQKAAGAKISSSADSVPILSGSSKRVVSSKMNVPQPTYYQVRGGDSLWKIAKRFNLQTEDIARWNNLKNDLIHPGLTLLLKI